MAATPATVPTSHSGIRPFVPVLDMSNIPLSKNKKSTTLHSKKGRVLSIETPMISGESERFS
jgi:hypothetical protein